MAPPTGAIVMRDSLVTVDGDEFANQVRKARLVPDVNIQTYKTLVPDGTVQDKDNATWNLELEGLQINETGGLAKALRDAVGTVLAVTIQPKTGTGKAKATIDVLIIEIPFGGEQGEYLTIDVTLPCQGAPVYAVSS
jgi:hypothetical protein